ncbi:hypothetical protein ACFL02_06110 [Planctomycetota bacterium]
MVNEFACPHCGKNLGYPTEPPGTELMCPYCQLSFHFPAGSGSSIPTSTGPTFTDPVSPGPVTPEPVTPEPAASEPVTPEPVIPETVLAGPESADDLSNETPTPGSRPAYSKKTAPPPPKTVPRSTSTPYIIPDLPRASSTTAVGYLGICAGVLGLLITLVLALGLILLKLESKVDEATPGIPQLLPLAHKLWDGLYNILGWLNLDLFIIGPILASFLGIFSLAWLWAGFGRLKEKKSARIVLWILGILAILIFIGGVLGYIKFVKDSIAG